MSRLSEDASIHPDCEVKNTDFGRYTELGRGTRILNSELGDYSYTDRYADIANTTVGKFSNIAAFSRIGPTDHPMELASMHHMLYRTDDYWDDVEPWTDFFEKRASRRTYVGHDTWIGSQAIIKPELNIGHGSVIAAGSVVTKDVAPFMIVAGVPAVPLRKRFEDDIAERLMTLSWWDWDHEKLRDALPNFRSLRIEAFLEKYES